ncbi:MAG: lipopolysaccharide biosynthesis protein [Ardenticatenaceae bacterium]|nr:lipopolysaccharide biosynthesis protein [Ardenticatenaceae bacterium]
MIRLIILRILESYFRHRWLYFLPILLMGIAGIAYVFVRPDVYMSGGSLYVKQESFLASLTSVRNSDAGWWVTPAESTVGEISDLLLTDAFMRSVIAKTDLAPNLDMDPDTVYETFIEARESVWLEEMGDNQVFVGAQHTDPKIAFQLVDGLIENYIQWKINADLVDSEAAQLFFSSIIQQYSEDVDRIHNELQAYLQAHPEPVRGDRPDLEQLEIDRLEAQLDLAEKRYSKALDKDEEAQLAASQAESDARQTYVLIDAPYVPEAPNTSTTQKAISVIVFGVIGTVLSIVGVAVGALIDRSFQFPLDVHMAINLPVLTSVPDVRNLQKQRQKESKTSSEKPVFDQKLVKSFQEA